MSYLYTINDVSWSMDIYIEIFFPCSQRKLLKLLKIIKDVSVSDGDYILKLKLLLVKMIYYRKHNAWDNEHEQLLKNEALIKKVIKEVGEKVRKEIENDNKYKRIIH